MAMKTTLNLNDALLTQAKALAAQQRTSLTRLIEEGLQLRLRIQRPPAKPVPPRQACSPACLPRPGRAGSRARRTKQQGPAGRRRSRRV